MSKLSDNWFAEGKIDFELKKYTLLAYLKEINLHFHKNKLYPHLGDIIFHYNNLLLFKKNRDSLKNNFPQRLSPASFEELTVVYEKIVADDNLMQEIEYIISFSLNEMDGSIREGKEIYDFVEDQLTIFPVGVVPLQLDNGYMFISDGNYRDVQVFEYQITIFMSNEEKFRGINTTFIDTFPLNLVNTFEQIKIDLLRSVKKPINPAVYCIETPLTFPLNETILPIARRSLVKHIAGQAA